jgi:small subunit ribosomal protein S18
VSGNCSQHQRDVAVAIKTARELALLPYTQRSVNERGPGGRGGRGPRDGRGGYPAAAPAAIDGDTGVDDSDGDVDVLDDDAEVEDAT